MDGKSLDIKQENIKKLKELMPEVFSEGDKIDIEKLKLTLGEDFSIENERYVLNWAGKSEAFKVLQTSTTATLAPVQEESINFDSTENIFIEGENLEVLKILQKSYYGKIKMIYIDPPYNTGNDSFIYPDKFSETKEEYLKRINEKDEEGYLLKEGLFRKNSKENGQYHSNWLNMMYPRLFLAKNLLRDDGVIFVSIDDNEVHNLRLMMNEIFGEENFVGEIVWRKRVSPANDAKWFSSDHEYIIVFAKRKELWYPKRLARNETQDAYYKNPDNDRRGPWNSAAYTCNKSEEERPNLYYSIVNPNTNESIFPKKTAVWAYSQETYKQHVKDNLLYWGKDGKSKSPRKKQFLYDAKNVVPRSVWSYDEVGNTQQATLEFLELFKYNYINYTKPKELITRLLELSIIENNKDIILDFFSGSATTAQAVYEMNKEDGGNRRYILVQLPEKIEEDTEAYKSGYKTIADIGKERIRRVIKKIDEEKKSKPELFENKELDLGFKVFKLKNSNFKLWRGDVIENGEDLEKQMDVFKNPEKEGAEEENILYELILKSGYELTERIEKKEGFYSIAENKLIIALSKFDSNTTKQILKLKPKRCIALDKLFNGNDKLKTNTVLQMKDAGVEFKTV
jgi:adenine-specific DNA-methyltransferase